MNDAAKGRGRVTLVGAGPGDPDLLTLRAVRALREADVVLVDDLVDRRVLEFVPSHARVVEVGKRGGCRSTPQQFIERLLVREARAGRHVVRLKGGDPFVFGRGREEMAALDAAGVDCEAVPGITAGVAAPAALAIPVTDRNHTHGVVFVTGHTRDDDEPGATGPLPGRSLPLGQTGAQRCRGPDWESLARSGLTLVIYMGVARCASIAARLLAAGLDPATPAAAIQHAHTPRQRSVVTTLARLAGDIERHALGAPAILVIGSVVALARQDLAAIAVADRKPDHAHRCGHAGGGAPGSIAGSIASSQMVSTGG